MRKKLMMSVLQMFCITLVYAHSSIDSIGSVPFRIEYFNAIEKDNGKIEINFKIAELFLIIEKYEVWKSTDKVNYILAGYVNRTSAQPISMIYQVIDQLSIAEKSAKIIYYKLRQVTNYGNYMEGHILPLKLKTNVSAKLSVWPNPIVQTVNISMYLTNDAGISFFVFNNNGSLVYSENVRCSKGNVSQVLHLDENIKKGIYVLQVKQNGILIDAKKIIKQ